MREWQRGMGTIYHLSTSRSFSLSLASVVWRRSSGVVGRPRRCPPRPTPRRGQMVGVLACFVQRTSQLEEKHDDCLEVKTDDPIRQVQGLVGSTTDPLMRGIGVDVCGDGRHARKATQRNAEQRTGITPPAGRLRCAAVLVMGGDLCSEWRDGHGAMECGSQRQSATVSGRHASIPSVVSVLSLLRLRCFISRTFVPPLLLFCCFARLSELP